MFTNFGFYTLLLTLLVNGISIFSNFTGFKKIIIFFCRLSFMFISISFISLIISFIISDFNNLNVFQNSHSSMPIMYKIAGAWGSHEGSMLLWIFVMNLYIFLFSFNKTLKFKIKRWAIFFQSILIFLFCLYVLLTSSPFLLNPINVNEGLGLNPILQDPLLVIHPPLLYLGYVGFSLIMSIALAGLITNDIEESWIKVTKIWSLFSWSLLTAGIAMGSYWAYYELGWGGWWFWDPVENVSLMPWLAGLALVHTLSITNHNHFLKRWAIFLSILCFSLSLIGTFLVRSGILTSVHSFASDTTRGLFILIIFFVVTTFSFLLFLVKSPKEKNNLNLLFINKPTALIINNIVMLLACFTVFLGTIYPIIIELSLNQRVSIGAPYFNKTVIPIVLPGLLLMSIAPILSWESNKFKNKLIYIYALILLSLIFIILSFFSTFSVFGILGLLLATWIILGTLFNIFQNLRKYKGKKYLFFLRTNNSLIAHFGVGLLILGITSSSVFQKEYSNSIKLNEKLNFDKYSLQLKKIDVVDKDNYQGLVGIFLLYEKNKFVGEIKPEKRFYKSNSMITTEAGIYNNIIEDFYLVIGDRNKEGWNIKFYVNPLVILIWLGAGIMFLSGIMSLWRF